MTAKATALLFLVVCVAASSASNHPHVPDDSELCDLCKAAVSFVALEAHNGELQTKSNELCETHMTIVPEKCNTVRNLLLTRAGEHLCEDCLVASSPLALCIKATFCPAEQATTLLLEERARLRSNDRESGLLQTTLTFMDCSDKRLKRELKLQGSSPSGVPMYTWIYKDDPTNTTYAGTVGHRRARPVGDGVRRRGERQGGRCIPWVLPVRLLQARRGVRQGGG